MTEPQALRIDFVSDVSCPWCAVGLASLERALDALKDEVRAEIHFQPFELNPQMPREGEDVGEHIAKKYGMNSTQLAQNQEAIRQRGAAVGFTFANQDTRRIYNTFDAHRLLHWAEGSGHQHALKRALLTAYFTDGRDVGDRDVLAQVAGSVGLDIDEARAVLDSDRYAADVRGQEQFFQRAGIHSVPAIIINRQHLISGGQPPEVFEQALRELATRS
ncbi:DsbA family oxidoreductase [Dyella sp.]|jgi:predicted DsbA family dithiol-disulfide isomerase|uniref:DsbA family oxidoreductase n=1 Tax=Dyella sp. TaxID=1869338 RepID=UPI002D7A3331|nr:DsbA family oxidoreductase [Dyella sp.]HET6431401.1 DsbA family oxidoreductase [Dyella sp.]